MLRRGRLGEQAEEILARRRGEFLGVDALQRRDGAAVAATKAGSLRLPRYGTGAR